MDIVESLRKYQCPENKGCNPVVEYCQCALMDSGADEIERLREQCFNYPALMDNLRHDTLIALHDHIHTIIDERAKANISQSRRAKAKKARAALKEKE
jgi:hypothetical protein